MNPNDKDVYHLGVYQMTLCVPRTASIWHSWWYRYDKCNLPVQITSHRERMDEKWTDLQSIITPDEVRVGKPYNCCVTTVLNPLL